MKRYIIFSLLLAGLASCKKEIHECDPATATPAATPSTSAFTKLTPGNYWIYDLVAIDTLGNETFLRTDSVYISRDTVHNGRTYVRYHELPYETWLADSAGFLVDIDGAIRFTTAITGFPVVTTPLDVGGFVEYQTLSARPTINVPAGTFANTYEWQGTVYLFGTEMITRYIRTNYAENIGVVRKSSILLDSPNVYERRLHHYHVQ